MRAKLLKIEMPVDHITLTRGILASILLLTFVPECVSRLVTTSIPNDRHGKSRHYSYAGWEPLQHHRRHAAGLSCCLRANLSHSFGNSSVGPGDIANFLNNTGLPTSNIFGRVTGGNISNIFGTIQTSGFGNANLFLMNPAGFLFGPNATVNVGGMMAFTTASIS